MLIQGTLNQHLLNKDSKLEETNKSFQKPVDEHKEIKKLSKEFEGIFLELLFKSMRQSVQKGGLIDGGNGEQVFQSMLDSEYAKNMANTSMTGLAASIEKSLLGKMGGVDKINKNKGNSIYSGEALRRRNISDTITLGHKTDLP